MRSPHTFQRLGARKIRVNSINPHDWTEARIRWYHRSDFQKMVEANLHSRCRSAWWYSPAQSSGLSGFKYMTGEQWSYQVVEIIYDLYLCVVACATHRNLFLLRVAFAIKASILQDYKYVVRGPITIKLYHRFSSCIYIVMSICRTSW